MKQCTFDTNIITAFLKNDLRVVEKVSKYLENFDKLTINMISYYEILRGLKDLGKRGKTEKGLGTSYEKIICIDRNETIEKAAELYA